MLEQHQQQQNVQLNKGEYNESAQRKTPLTVK